MIAYCRPHVAKHSHASFARRFCGLHKSRFRLENGPLLAARPWTAGEADVAKMPPNHIETYRHQMEQALRQGNATKNTHRPVLQDTH